MYRFDKSRGQGYKAEEQQSDYAFWSEKTLRERLEAAYYLNSCAFNYDPHNPPRMDKTVFEARKRN